MPGHVLPGHIFPGQLGLHLLCHTWSIINRPYYPCSSCHYSSICGSYREEIVEEVDPEEEVIETADNDEVDPEFQHSQKMKLCCSIGCSEESVEEQITLSHINNVRQERSKSLPDMLDGSRASSYVFLKI